jgi:hypothetical protein
MKLSKLKQLIKEEFLREIKIEAPKPLKLIRVPNGYELAIGPYITNYRLRRTPPPGYEIMPGFVDAYIDERDSEDNGEFIFTVVEPLEELEKQSVDKIYQIFNKFNVKFEFIEPHYFLIPFSQASFQDEINEIKVEKPSDVRLVFVPMQWMSKNVDPVTGEKGEPKLVLGNEYIIARDDIKVPEGYVHIKVGDDYYNNIGANEYHIKIDKDDELKKVKDLLDKYKVKYFFSDMSNHNPPYYSFLISTDQISNAEGWIS